MSLGDKLAALPDSVSKVRNKRLASYSRPQDTNKRRKAGSCVAGREAKDSREALCEHPSVILTIPAPITRQRICLPHPRGHESAQSTTSEGKAASLSQLPACWLCSVAQSHSVSPATKWATVGQSHPLCPKPEAWKLPSTLQHPDSPELIISHRLLLDVHIFSSLPAPHLKTAFH